MDVCCDGQPGHVNPHFFSLILQLLPPEMLGHSFPPFHAAAPSPYLFCRSPLPRIYRHSAGASHCLSSPGLGQAQALSAPQQSSPHPTSLGRRETLSFFSFFPSFNAFPAIALAAIASVWLLHAHSPVANSVPKATVMCLYSHTLQYENFV